MSRKDLRYLMLRRFLTLMAVMSMGLAVASLALPVTVKAGYTVCKYYESPCDINHICGMSTTGLIVWAIPAVEIVPG